MNREILFRGKRVDSGEWVYGAFVPDALEMLKGARCLDGFIRRCNQESLEVDMFEVDRKTVGQFTGLTDKNGVKIFEGDLLKICGFTYPVACLQGAFVVTCEELQNPLSMFTHVGEVIGNIHDNPEMLEGEENA